MKNLSYTLAASVLLVACNSTTQPSMQNSSSSSEAANGGTIEVSWEFEETRRAEYDQPFSNVTVKLTGAENKEILVGEFSGTCALQDKAEVAKEGSDVISGARCWWAGAGEDFLIRRKSPGTLRIEHRAVDEGTAEEAAPVFPYKLIGDEISIAENASIR